MFEESLRRITVSLRVGTASYGSAILKHITTHLL